MIRIKFNDLIKKRYHMNYDIRNSCIKKVPVWEDDKDWKKIKPLKPQQ